MKDEFENSLGQIESYLEEQRAALASKKSSTKKQIATQAERNRQRFDVLFCSFFSKIFFSFSQKNVELFNRIAQSTEFVANPFELIQKQLQQQIAPLTKKKKKKI